MSVRTRVRVKVRVRVRGVRVNITAEFKVGWASLLKRLCHISFDREWGRGRRLTDESNNIEWYR